MPDGLGAVAQAYCPGYLGGRVKEDPGSKASMGKKFRKHHLND
jgi:hypothetical protein